MVPGRNARQWQLQKLYAKPVPRYLYTSSRSNGRRSQYWGVDYFFYNPLIVQPYAWYKCQERRTATCICSSLIDSLPSTDNPRQADAYCSCCGTISQTPAA